MKKKEKNSVFLESSAQILTTEEHRRMAKGGHGLPKASLGPAMTDPSMPCGQAIPEKALRLF
jgi:hypothetical protein